MPKYNDITKFKKYYKKIEHPYLIYIYVEAFLQKLEIIKLERKQTYTISNYNLFSFKSKFFFLNTNYIYN